MCEIKSKVSSAVSILVKMAFAYLVLLKCVPVYAQVGKSTDGSLCDHTELPCKYDGSCCLLGEQICSDTAKSCENLFPNLLEADIFSICCLEFALNESTKIDKIEACLYRYQRNQCVEAEENEVSVGASEFGNIQNYPSENSSALLTMITTLLVLLIIAIVAIIVISEIKKMRANEESLNDAELRELNKKRQRKGRAWASEPQTMTPNHSSEDYEGNMSFTFKSSIQNSKPSDSVIQLEEGAAAVQNEDKKYKEIITNTDSPKPGSLNSGAVEEDTIKQGRPIDTGEM